MAVLEAPVDRPSPGWDADEAVTRLFAAHYRSLVRLATLLLREPGPAEDVVQDAYVALHGRWRAAGGRQGAGVPAPERGQPVPARAAPPRGGGTLRADGSPAGPATQRRSGRPHRSREPQLVVADPRRPVSTYSPRRHRESGGYARETEAYRAFSSRGVYSRQISFNVNRLQTAAMRRTITPRSGIAADRATSAETNTS